MSSLFKDQDDFNEDISHWDVSNVTNMSGMFSYADAFDQPIGDWDVSNVTSTRSMFLNTDAFNQSIGKWDVSSMTNMWNMFRSTTAFNQPIGDWDVSNVTNMWRMFRNTDAFDQNISGWCVSQISSEPDSFAVDAALTAANKPTWGTCPPPNDIVLSPNKIAVSSASGTTVGTLSATDDDQTDGHTFVLIAGTGDTDNAKYSIEGTTLKLATVAPSSATTHSVRVQATDEDGLAFEKMLTINYSNR